MDSAFILCFLLLGIRLTQALTPDEYISLRRQNHTSQRDAIRPSAVQIFMHRPKHLKTKISSQPDLMDRRSEKFQVSGPSEYYSEYEDIPTAPKKQQPPTKPAFAYAKYDDYYPVRKSSSKTKSHRASPKQKRPVEEKKIPENTDYIAPREQGKYMPPIEQEKYIPPREQEKYTLPREQGKYIPPREQGKYIPPREQKEYIPPREDIGEVRYPKIMHEEREENKMISAEESTTHRHIHDDKRKKYREHQILNNKRQNRREEPKSMSASEQVQKLMSQSEEDKMFVAATGYGGSTRGQFHEQGMEGPHSYKFGYNTGDSYNPMARYEERDSDGHVRGSYSYVDATGKLQVVHYESHPKLGFRTKSGHGSYPY